MRSLGKVLILFFSLVIIMLSLPFSASANAENRFGRSILSSMPNGAAMVGAYDELNAGCSEAKKEIRLENRIDEDQLSYVVNALCTDYPEYFWLTGGYQYTRIGFSNQIASVSPDYLFTKDNISSASASLEAMSKDLLSGLEGKSDYEKSLILHDRLAERVVYKSTKTDQTAYGAIVEGEAVCAGYAKAYHYLLNKAGIEAWSVRGESVNPTTNKKEGHRWNMVKLDGKWYYSDVTWDDQSDTTYHNYLNRTLTYFNQTHFPDMFQEHLPDDNSTAADYFVKNGLVFKNVNADKIVALLKKSNNQTSFYADGNVDSFLNDLKGKMKDIAVKLGAKGGASYTYITSTLGNEIFLKVIIEQKNHTHSPKKVNAVAPTCVSTGLKEYYKCSCGRIFADSKGKTELDSTASLIIEKTDHTISDDLKFDAHAHWKYCTVCQTAIEGSSATHEDEDNDHICDTCTGEIEDTSSDTAFTLDDLYFALTTYWHIIVAALVVVAVIVVLVLKK